MSILPNDDLAAAAQAYARNGHAVFPLWPGRKVPCVKHGLHEATCDIDTIRQWWAVRPDSNIAIRPAPGQFVLDVETLAGHRVNGYATLAALVAEIGPLPTAPVAVTSTGGLHIWLSGAQGKLVNSLGPGVDVKAHNGYLVAPPSRFDTWQGIGDPPLECAPRLPTAGGFPCERAAPCTGAVAGPRPQAEAVAEAAAA